VVSVCRHYPGPHGCGGGNHQYGCTFCAKLTHKEETMNMNTNDAEIKRILLAERNAAHIEVARLRATIIEADSAYNIGGEISTWDETAGLVRLCHEGASALKQVAQLRAALLAFEWVEDRDGDFFCPWCGRYLETDNGRHHPDCQRQIALGLVEVTQ
jgi:hypothetical protein